MLKQKEYEHIRKGCGMAQGRKVGSRNTSTSSGTSSTPKKKQMSASEMREWYEKYNKSLINYKKAEEAFKKLKDVSKSTRDRTITKITKDSLRTYLENPGNYESQLRDVSRYLATRCQVYYRLIKYNANMFCLDARTIIPPYNPSETEKVDPQKILASYYNTITLLNKMGLQYEFLKAYVTCFTEDVFYGVVYFDETAESYPSMFFLPLNPSYCKIQGVWQDGTFSYAFDMSYFNRNADFLELWGEPFESMWKEYQSSNVKWQTVPQEYSVCLKFRAEDWETVIPPFAGLLSSFLGLLEEEDVQAIASEEEIYKLLVLTMPTLEGTDTPDDFSVDPDTAIDYFEKLKGSLPSFVDAILSPLPVEAVSFNKDVTGDTVRVQEATETVLNSSGGAQVLNTTKLKTSAAFEAMIKADTEFAISSLLPQTEAWINSFVARYVDSPCRVKLFEVSVYTKDSLRKDLLENAQNGLPTKLAVNTLDGISELDTLALNFLEESCLHLSDILVPLNTSYTQSQKEAGGQEKDVTDLTDEGAETRDSDKNGQ